MFFRDRCKQEHTNRFNRLLGNILLLSKLNDNKVIDRHQNIDREKSIHSEKCILNNKNKTKICSFLLSYFKPKYL